MNEVTVCLEEIAAGDLSATARLMPIVYNEMRALAGSYLRDERVGHTLEPTALVHEVFLKLTGNQDLQWESRSHFFAVAAKAMRHVLTDYARRAGAEKRGGGWSRVTLSGIASDRHVDVDLVSLGEALDVLGEISARQSQIVELRFFGGLGVESVADLLDVSPRTVELDWRMARAWLRRRLAVSG